jgi:hypothetical protein
MNTPAFDSMALFNKSRRYAHRAIDARNNMDHDQFQLWSSLSLELLAKAALASINPCLIADPQHWPSLFAASGGPIQGEYRTIIAKTAFERLTHIHKRFGAKERDFCMLLSTRRNSELHSGELPFEDIRPDSWVPKFWSVASIILEAAGQSLEKWIGEKEAHDAVEIIEERLSALEQAVQARIEIHRRDFEKLYPKGSEARRLFETLRRYKAHPHYVSISDSEKTDAVCPACGLHGELTGIPWNVIKHSPEFDGEVWSQTVTKDCASEYFQCRYCELELDGVDEIKSAGLSEEFEISEEVTPDYGEDYQNE